MLASSIHEALAASLPLTLVGGLTSVLILLFVLALCACKDKNPQINRDRNDLKEVSVEQPKKKKNGKNHKKQPSGTTAITVDVDAEVADNRHSNGSVANGRPKSHDRALPAIPAVSGGEKGTAATDDDDEELQDEGHYDVITRPKNKAAGAEAKQSKKSQKRGANPYEIVTGEQDSDSTYAGIKEDNESAKLSFAGAGYKAHSGAACSQVNVDLIDPTYSGIQDDQSPTKSSAHPYAVVNSVGDAQYAHIDDITVAKKQIRRSLLQQGHAAESMETLDGSYASVPPPPVPDKNFDAASETVDLSSLPGAQLSSSPSLPPRNSVAAANGSGAPGNPLDTSLTSNDGDNNAFFVAVACNGGTMAVNGVNGASIVTVGHADATGAAAAAADIAAIKEASYSKVTARESLDNLKKRQAAEARHKKQLAPVLDLDPDDSTYASVTYDEIRSPGAAEGTSMPQGGDRQSMNSDLYAEIASGQNSSRSSTYAHVGDGPSVVFSDQAPAPPPLDLLRQLPQTALTGRDNDEETADPGYSVIKRPRPQSVHTTTANQNLAVAAVPSGRRSPVYAVVNRQNRQTVHLPLNVEKEIVRSASPGTENMYTEVNKAGKGKLGIAGGKLEGEGARPKERANCAASQAVSEGTVSGTQATARPQRDMEPGYQTIGSVGEQSSDVSDEARYDPDYDHIKSDPNYDLIKEQDVIDGGSDYDPNYESVTTLTASITGSASGARSPTEPGVAREIAPSSAAQGVQRWQPRREHIYQDIDEAKGSMSRGKKVDPSVAQGSTAL